MFSVTKTVYLEFHRVSIENEIIEFSICTQSAIMIAKWDGNDEFGDWKLTIGLMV